MAQTAFSFSRPARSRVFLWVLLCTIIGVAAAPYLPNIINPLGFVIGGLLVSAIFLAGQYRLVALLLLGLAVCWLRYDLAIPKFPTDSVVHFDQQRIELIGTVVREEDRRVDHTKLTVTTQLVNDQPANGLVLLKVPLYPMIEYGQTIQTSCYLRRPGVIEDFRYDHYLALTQVYATCTTRNVKVLDDDGGSLLYQGILKGKRYFISTINKLLPEPQASFLAGLLVGARRGIPSELLEDFNRTGTTHIIAISGYNITIIATITLALLGPLIGRKRAFWFIVGLIVVFVIITGAQASVVRAGIMGVLVLLARQLGRASRVVNVLALTAVIMTMVNPLILKDDAGFQLSFLATLGLIYISPVLEKYLIWLPKQFGFQESVLATLSATIATLPLTVFTFGRLSLVALVVNVMILAVIPLTMALGAMAVLLAAIWWPLGVLMSWLVWVCLSYIIRIVEWFAALSWSSVDLPELHWLIVVGLFSLLTWFILPRLSLLRAPAKGFRYEHKR